MATNYKTLKTVEPALREILAKYSVNGKVPWKTVLVTAPEAQPLRDLGIGPADSRTIYSFINYYIYARGRGKPKKAVVIEQKEPTKPKPSVSAPAPSVTYCPRCGCNIAAVSVALSL